MTKKQLGQFFTANSEYILQGFEKYITDKDITDPFAGGQDLLKWAENYSPKNLKGYDIDDKYIDNKRVFKNDGLANPLKYDFVLTNPPYLYINKMEQEQKSVFKNTKHTDLYQLSLERIMDCKEGIAIVPINFLSSSNAKYIRDIFLSKFEIKEVNFFTEQVFPDTTYTVMAFYFCLKQEDKEIMEFPMRIFPEGITKPLTIYKKHNWQIGGEFLSGINNQKNILRIRRLVEDDLKTGTQKIKLSHNHIDNINTYELSSLTTELIKKNIILLKAIDTGSKGGEICLEDIRKYGIDGLISIPTSRNQVFLIFEKELTIKEQEKLIDLFNKTINDAREKYFSLFMTNYRDKNRKRISFNFAYKLINYLYFNNFEL